MGDYRHAPSSRSSRSLVPRDISRLQAQQDSLHTRLMELKAVIEEKDAVIKGQTSTIKLYEFKFAEIREQNAALKRAVAVLSEHITAKLKADLPILPDIPQEEGLKREDFATFSSPSKRRKRKKSPSKGVNQSFSAGLQVDFPTPPRLFNSFSGAEFLKAVLEAQMARKDFQKRLFAFSAARSREALLAPTQIALFETLSFFLSCRNVAFLNNYTVFFPRVLEMLGELLEVEQVTVYEKDPVRELLWCRATTGFAKKQLSFPLNFGHFAVLHKVKGPVIIANALEDPNFDSEYSYKTGVSIKNLACVPLSTSEDIFGVLECCNKRRSFSPADLIVMNHVAKQLSVGMMGLLVKEKVQKLVSKGPNSQESIDNSHDSLLMPILQALLSSLTYSVSCERATLFVYASKTHELVSLLGTGLEGVIRLPLTRGLASAVFNTSTVINCADASSHPDFLPSIDAATGYATKQVVAVSVGSQGVLECLNTVSGEAFSEADVRIIKATSQTLVTILSTMEGLSGVLLEADMNALSLQYVETALLLLNRKGFISQTNRFACELLGLAPERIVGMTLTELLEDTPQLLLQLMAALDSQEVTAFKSVSICISKDDLRRRKEATVRATLVPVTGKNPGCLLLLYPL
jgi:PAS domain-containing protein